MKEDERLKALAWVANRSNRQISELYELCNKNFDTLLRLEAVIKEYHVVYCPSTSE